MKSATLPSRAAIGLLTAIVASFIPWTSSFAAEPHPRKAEVMNRDRHLAGKMNKDYGDLSGHYNQLSRSRMRRFASR